MVNFGTGLLNIKYYKIRVLGGLFLERRIYKNLFNYQQILQILNSFPREEIAAEVHVVVLDSLVGAWMTVPAKNKLKNERQRDRITLGARI